MSPSWCATSAPFTAGPTAWCGTGATERLARDELDLQPAARCERRCRVGWERAVRPWLQRCARADPDASMWVWGADPHVRFWSRRMLHETTVHRIDAELAFERDPDVDADVAADGIDELFENLPAAANFAPKVAALRGDGESMQLEGTDADFHRLVRLEPNGFTWTRERVPTCRSPSEHVSPTSCCSSTVGYR